MIVLVATAADDIWYLPNAMSQDEPPAASDSAWAGALTFEYAYPELPESVIARFIVRAHEWIDANQVLRWGVILAWEAKTAPWCGRAWLLFRRMAQRK